MDPGRGWRYVGGGQRHRIRDRRRNAHGRRVVTALFFTDTRGCRHRGRGGVSGGRLRSLTGRWRVPRMTLGDGGHPLWWRWWRALGGHYDHTTARLGNLRCSKRNAIISIRGGGRKGGGVSLTEKKKSSASGSCYCQRRMKHKHSHNQSGTSKRAHCAHQQGRRC